jgi:V/A-type H+-transporting ATPase subunit E
MTESTDVFNMMKDEILANAEEKAKEIVNQANHTANEISEDAKMRAERVSKAIVEQAKKEADLELRRETAKAKLTARSDTLRNKEEIINDIFDQAQKKLASFANSSDYASTLNNLITEGAIGLNGGDLKIKIQTGHGKFVDTNKIQRSVMQQTGTATTLTVVEDNLRSIGGAIVANADETILIDNTFEARLRRMREEIRTKIAKILFE